MPNPTRNERRYWMYHSFGFALLTALLAVALWGVPVGFVVLAAWASLGGFARFVLDNLTEDGSSS
jgi:hypothetical protein